jgi:hypothetical protein
MRQMVMLRSRPVAMDRPETDARCFFLLFFAAHTTQPPLSQGHVPGNLQAVLLLAASVG